MDTISVADQESLKSLMKMPEWASMQKVLTTLIEMRRSDCETAREDHRFYQGRASGIRELVQYLNMLEHPHAAVSAPAVEKFMNLARGGRSATGGY